MKKQIQLWTPNDSPEMKLPDGMTCGNCQHYDRCEKLVNVHIDNTICDFFPSSFTPSLRTKAKTVLNTAVKEADVADLEENPLPVIEPTKLQQQHIEENRQMLIKPQPKSGGSYGSIEI